MSETRQESSEATTTRTRGVGARSVHGRAHADAHALASVGWEHGDVDLEEKVRSDRFWFESRHDRTGGDLQRIDAFRQTAVAVDHTIELVAMTLIAVVAYIPSWGLRFA